MRSKPIKAPCGSRSRSTTWISGMGRGRKCSPWTISGSAWCTSCRETMATRLPTSGSVWTCRSTISPGAHEHCGRRTWPISVAERSPSWAASPRADVTAQSGVVHAKRQTRAGWGPRGNLQDHDPGDLRRDLCGLHETPRPVDLAQDRRNPWQSSVLPQAQVLALRSFLESNSLARPLDAGGREREDILVRGDVGLSPPAAFADVPWWAPGELVRWIRRRAFRHFGRVPEEAMLENDRGLVSRHDRFTREVEMTWDSSPGSARRTGLGPRAGTRSWTRAQLRVRPARSDARLRPGRGLPWAGPALAAGAFSLVGRRAHARESPYEQAQATPGDLDPPP